MAVRKTIVVVEDEADIAELMCWVLERQGYRVRWAASAKEALCLMRQIAVDLVVTDYAMPRMSGGELLRAMADDVELIDIPAVVVSAYPAETVRNDCRTMRALLQKPFKTDTFVQAISKILGREERPGSGSPS